MEILENNDYKNDEVIDKNIYKLSRPLNIDGEEIKVLNVDLYSLTGKDLMTAEKVMNMHKKKGEFTPVVETNKTYQACVLAKACKLKYEDILNVNAKDFAILTNKVMNFLLGEATVEEEAY